MLKYINFYELAKKSIPGPYLNSNTFVEMSNSNPLIIADMLENIVYSNQAFKNIFGNNNFDKITCLKTEPDMEYLLRTFAQSNYSGFECEIDILNPEIKSKKDFFISVERIFINESEYLILGFKPQEEKLKVESKLNTLNHALDYGNIPAMILDDSGRITFSTSYNDLIFNTSIDLIYSKPIYEALDQYLDKYEQHSLIDSIKNKLEWSSVIFTQVSEVEYYFEFKLMPISTNGGGTNFIFRGHDVTEHINKAELIKKNEEQLKSIINNVSDLLLIVKNRKGVFYFEDANENFCKIFSVDKSLYHQEVSKVIKEDIIKEFVDHVCECSIDKQNIPEFNYTFNDRCYAVKTSAIINSIEDELMYIITLNDITDQMNYQEQLKKAFEKENHFNRLKGSILKNMSHEIRTPLNALMGYSEIIEEDLISKDFYLLKDITQSLKDILNRILNLFLNIVEVSQIESEEYDLEIDTHNVNKILKAVYNKKLPEARNKKLNFKIEINEEEALIDVDWMKMEKVIFALVDNAIKYTLNGNVTLKSEVENNLAVISIIDSGIGMDKENIKNFIEAFVQAEEGYTKYFEGAGLGLTMAYNYVEKMNGTININSELEKGTIVQLLFPITADKVAG